MDIGWYIHKCSDYDLEVQLYKISSIPIDLFFFFFGPTKKLHRHYFVNKGPPSQGYGLSSGHVRVGL